MASRITTKTLPRLHFHNGVLAKCLRQEAADSPTSEELTAVKTLLDRHGVTDVSAGLIPQSGLYSAAVVAAKVTEANTAGYANAWTRDNALVAHSLLACGQVDAASSVAKALATFYTRYVHRLDAIISGDGDASDEMQRPHIRFNGQLLEENRTGWPHKQNDACGYFMWIFAKLACAGHLEASNEHLNLIAKFVRYLDKVRYWEDEDSGHWEEAPKVQASSIGAALAGIREAKALLEQLRASFTPEDVPGQPPLAEVFARADAEGSRALASILPNESVQPGKEMSSNGALLFLVHPLEVVDDTMAGAIVERVVEKLMGPVGVRRYLGDSYWHQDWLDIPVKVRSRIQEVRDKALEPGLEAQWCIFDPVLSIIHAKAFRRRGDVNDLELQRYFLKRSLAQVTGEDCRLGPWKLPESYHSWHAEWVPNDVCPLLWTQANAAEALEYMRTSLQSLEGPLSTGQAS